MRVSVIIPAGGNSTRFNSSDHQASDVLGALRSKLDEDLGGKTVLQRTVELFNTRDDVQQIIVAGPSDPQAFTSFKEQHGDRLSLLGVKLIQGGQIDRWQTVQLAIDQVDPTCTHIAVHDAARPATPIELIDRIFDAAKRLHTLCMKQSIDPMQCQCKPRKYLNEISWSKRMNKMISHRLMMRVWLSVWGARCSLLPVIRPTSNSHAPKTCMYTLDQSISTDAQHL